MCDTTQVFDDAPSRLYESLHSLITSLLCDPTTSPFLLPAPTTSRATSDVAAATAALRPHDGSSLDVVDNVHDQDQAVVTWLRPLISGLGCLGAHEDLGQKEIVLVRSFALFLASL